MTVPTDVDRTAPVSAVHEIEIEAPLDTVWRFHTDVNAWPTWQTEITDAHIEGTLEPGRSFDWTRPYGVARRLARKLARVAVATGAAVEPQLREAPVWLKVRGLGLMCMHAR